MHKLLVFSKIILIEEYSIPGIKIVPVIIFIWYTYAGMTLDNRRIALGSPYSAKLITLIIIALL